MLSRRMALCLCGATLVQARQQISPAQAADRTLTPDQALNMLLRGNQRFITNPTLPDLSADRRQTLAISGRPFASILGCADSRVPPDYIFNTGLGDIYTDRVCGNTLSPSILGSIEYSVSVLQVPIVMVLGHENCAAVITALNYVISGRPVSAATMVMIDPFLPIIDDVHGRPGDLITNVVQENARRVAAQVTNDATVETAIENGRLKVVAAYYSMNAGTVTIL